MLCMYLTPLYSYLKMISLPVKERFIYGLKQNEDTIRNKAFELIYVYSQFVKLPTNTLSINELRQNFIPTINISANCKHP